MEDLSTEMLCLRGNEETLGFGFNDLDFSDRVLLIEITPVHNTDDSYCSVGVEVKRVHITSLILASKSSFFRKLFKNGMKDSQSKETTLKISSSEETALMDLLKFMYINTLSATTNSDLLDVLIVADKYEVISCTRYCIQLLSKTLMSVDSAVSYLDLPSNVLVAKEVQPLIDAAKLYLLARFKDFKNSLEDAMKLSLPALEFVLRSGGLRVDSEDDVFNFILKWAHAHYPKPEECRAIMTNRLVQFICFPYMSCSKLKKVLVLPEFACEEVSKLVMEALFFKAEVLSTEHGYVPNKLESFAGDLYHDRLVKAARRIPSWPSRVIYFDLKKEECESMTPSNSLYSQPFLLGGLWFFLMAQRRENDESSIDHFRLFLKTRKGSRICKVLVTVDVMKLSSNKFERRMENDIFCLKNYPVELVLRTPWTTFTSDDSEFFIDGILRFRVYITPII